MADTVVVTANRGWSLPNPNNNARADAQRILDALNACDADMALALRVATTILTGQVRLSTIAEAQAGSLATIAITPAGLAQVISDLRNGAPVGRTTLKALSDAIDLLAPKLNPTFTGTVTIPTVAGTTDASTAAASTAFVQAVAALKANLLSPVFTGTPQVPTATAGTNTLQAASTAFVQAALAALVNSSPAALDTLKELADAIGDDPNFATTITNALATKATITAMNAGDAATLASAQAYAKKVAKKAALVFG